MGRRYFGTDGIRGRVGEFPITPEFVLKLGWAAGRVLARHQQAAKSSKPRILIGKDTRISGYMFESALEAGLSAAGVDIYLLGPMPTPAIAYLTRTFHAAAGIVISASHNPFADNGIKFFNADGSKLPDAWEDEIEAELEQPMQTVAPEALGKAVRVNDAAGRYIEYCKSTLPYGTSLAGLHLVVDCAHGATYHIAPAVLKELGAQVTVMAAQPDGFNINAQVGSTHPQALQARVQAESADLGIAFDGDGDRVVMVDAQGRLLDGDDLLYILATYMQQENNLQGGVVGTLMSNLGLELALQAQGIDFIRAPVGDRYVMAELVAQQWRLGGESSGHLVCRHVQTTGDGIVAALQVLAALLAAQTQDISQLLQPMRKLPQVLINVKAHAQILQDAQVQAQVAQVEAELGHQGRVLLRASGTEPVIRVMVEGQKAQQVQALAEQIAETLTHQSQRS
ncbi:phosphoglucosamine mutase [Allopseudospirillum japonicum]|uniref:Phosphoglucosamine mutase n=1 Tax=Allopseudospirillum japonicum TaxID=64971 RepID=A0A1H6R4V9_9GAMM|nr:phosphoglucosamine mutase [Allopseudospirillum japonicum]SEI49486.1 phosphoglucosamine mutase [Allopseudospirillum japonicum]